MSKKIPMRICVGCREMKEKRTMIRVVHTQDGSFHIDAGGKMNGRGAYICRNADCLARALTNHGLERSFQTKVPKETVLALEKEMEMIAK